MKNKLNDRYQKTHSWVTGMLPIINELISIWAKILVSRKTTLAYEKSKLKPFEFSMIKSKT